MGDLIAFNNKEVDSLKMNSVFATVGYLKALSNNFGAFEKDGIKTTYYIKNAFKIKRLTITALEFEEKNITEERFNNFFNAILNYIKRNKIADFITCPPSFMIFPYEFKKGFNVPFGTVRNNLELDEDTLFKNLHGKHRNVIRKAEKNNLTFHFGKELKDACYHVIKGTLERESIFFEPRDEFNRICNGIESNIQFFAVKLNNEIQGAAIIPYDKKCAYYLWGGSIKNPSTGAMNFLHWNVMLHFKAKGLEFYDFVGARINPEKNSKLYNLRRFKTRFGGEELDGFLWKIEINKTKSNLFKLLYFIRNRQLPSDIIENESKR